MFTKKTSSSSSKNTSASTSTSAPVLPCPNSHAIDYHEVARILDVDIHHGLSSANAAARLAKYGTNDLQAGKGIPVLRIFLTNLINTMNVVLFAFGIACLATKSWVEAGIIAVVIIANTAFGFFTEIKSAKTIDALKKLSSPTARVVRDTGDIQLIPSTHLVPGDLVCLEEGDQVPADVRIIDTVNLKLNEALLTGESEPIKKHTHPVPLAAALGDQVNMAFKSTLVNLGRGRGLVVATGRATEIGKIAQQVTEASFSFKRTPLEMSMANMMRVLLLVALVLIFIVIASSHFAWSNERVWMYAVALAVAILPEGLPIVTMITMSIGVARMAKEKAIVRKQVSLELLGRVTNICSDKTGTLTEGKMTMTVGWLGEQWVLVEGAFHEVGRFYLADAGAAASPSSKATADSDANANANANANAAKDAAPVAEMFSDFFLVAALCNTCEIQLDLDTRQFVGLGDTTEVALAVVATREGFTKTRLATTYALVAEFPFDSSLKRMSVVYRHTVSHDLLVVSKGALESIWPLCAHYAVVDPPGRGPATALLPATQAYYDTTVVPRMLDMSMKGQRVLALALRRVPAADVTPTLLAQLDAGSSSVSSDRDTMETQYVFLGLVGIVDPPRPETPQAIQDCHRAGIVVHMITGDHPSTAAAIAREIGILPSFPKVLTANTASGSTPANTTTTTLTPSSPAPVHLDDGSVMTSTQFDALTETEVDALAQLPLVVARCSPDTKVNMIRALHRRGKYVAMTGDGVNDAPAVSHADIGIAMGQGGSDVTKQASDITLTDDRFSSIVKAIAQGRRIFANIQKFTLHLLSGNVSEMVVLVCGLAVRNALDNVIYPMSPSQILYLNLVTSSPVALALGIEKASKKIMHDPPRAHGVFTMEMVLDTWVYGVVLGLLSLLCFLAVLVFPGHHHGITLICDTQMGPHEECEPVFRARAVGFVTLCLLLLLHGFVCRHPSRTSFYFKLKDSTWLVYLIVFFSALSAALPYIPYVNHEIFHHAPFGWEWGYVVASIAVFLVFSEAYKFGKRVYRARQRRRQPQQQQHLVGVDTELGGVAVVKKKKTKKDHK